MISFNDYELLDYEAKTGVDEYRFISYGVSVTHINVLLKNKQTSEKFKLSFDFTKNDYDNIVGKLKMDNSSIVNIIEYHLKNNFTKILRQNKLNNIFNE
jgi:hypothetical protein